MQGYVPARHDWKFKYVNIVFWLLTFLLQRTIEN